MVPICLLSFKAMSCLSVGRFVGSLEVHIELRLTTFDRLVSYLLVDIDFKTSCSWTELYTGSFCGIVMSSFRYAV
jgi:hypothetical protein